MPPRGKYGERRRYEITLLNRNGSNGFPKKNGGEIMTELTIITVDDAYKRTKSGNALLVCAYDDKERFQKFHLEGAIPYQDFESRLSRLSKNRAIIFYCA